MTAFREGPYEEIVTRANAERNELLYRLSPRFSPFTHEPQLVWVCDEDVWDYICYGHRFDIQVSEGYSFLPHEREILYMGLPVRIKPYRSGELHSGQMFVATILNDGEIDEYVKDFYFDWFPAGSKILKGDYLFEVVESGRHRSVSMIGMAFDYERYMHWKISSRPYVPYDNETYTSYDLSRLQGTSSAEFDRKYWEWDGWHLREGATSSRAKLDDNFESADLSILFGTAPNE